jgi:predicted GIY-YIG superfamily endonuclease
MAFWAYMLHCRGGYFYVGQTDDLERRIGEHMSGLIPGFTADHLPVDLVWTQEFVTRYEAKTAEKQIKGWSRAKKLALIRGDWERISVLAKKKDSPLRLAGKASRSGQASTSSGQTGR